MMDAKYDAEKYSKINRKESSTKLSAISLVYCKRLFGNLLLYNTLV